MEMHSSEAMTKIMMAGERDYNIYVDILRKHIKYNW